LADLALRRVYKSFRGKSVLENITFDVRDREFFVIFGPSGAGKTTILNTISGIYVPDLGEVLLNHRVVNALEPSERNVAMVFENYALYPHWTVFENMASPLKSPKYRKSRQEAEREVRRIAEMLRIGNLLDRKPAELSNGQRQRVALGRALVRNPDVFLMDEPLTHLDAKLRHLMRAELKEMQQSLHTTTVYVTHDYLEALSLGDRIAVLNQGRIEQIGTPHDIYYRPINEFVAESFGDPEINLLDAELTDREGRLFVRVGGYPEPFPVREELRRQLESAETRRIRVGLRPGDIHYRLDPGETGIPSSVFSFEPLGAKAIVTCRFDKDWVRVLAPAELDLRPDQPIWLDFDMDKALFFHPENRRLVASPAA